MLNEVMAEPKPTVPEVLPLVIAYKALPGNDIGGSLHVLLDDYNVSDSTVEFCINWAIEHGDEPGEHLARLLLRMSRTQRAVVARRANGRV